MPFAKAEQTGVRQALQGLDAVDPYWARLRDADSALYALTRGFELTGRAIRLRQVVELRKAMSSEFYAAYIRKRSKKLTQEVARLDLGWTGGRRGPAPMRPKDRQRDQALQAGLIHILASHAVAWHCRPGGAGEALTRAR